MILKIQINLIVFSILYGFFVGVTLHFFDKYIHTSRKRLKVFFTLFYVVFNVVIYFIFLKIINDGILHYYSFICIIMGVFIQNKIFK